MVGTERSAMKRSSRPQRAKHPAIHGRILILEVKQGCAEPVAHRDWSFGIITLCSFPDVLSVHSTLNPDPRFRPVELDDVPFHCKKLLRTQTSCIGDQDHHLYVTGRQ